MGFRRFSVRKPCICTAQFKASSKQQTCMYVRMYVCMYVCMYTYIHTYIHTYVHTVYVITRGFCLVSKSDDCSPALDPRDIQALSFGRCSLMPLGVILESCHAEHLQKRACWGSFYGSPPLPKQAGSQKVASCCRGLIRSNKIVVPYS